LEKGLVSEESMAVNFSMATLPQSATLKLHILLKRNDEGNAIASVLELPNCQVEALTHEQVIEDLKKLLLSSSRDNRNYSSRNSIASSETN
jgi:hypothetical protein